MNKESLEKVEVHLKKYSLYKRALETDQGLMNRETLIFYRQIVQAVDILMPTYDELTQKFISQRYLKPNRKPVKVLCIELCISPRTLSYRRQLILKTFGEFFENMGVLV